jgi:hypothetical protein
MSHPRTLVPSPLARLLRAWARLDTNAAPADPAGRLGEWLSAVDSVRLDAALQAIDRYAASAREVASAVDVKALAERHQRFLTDTADWLRSLPLMDEALGDGQVTSYGPCQQRYLTVQKQLENRVNAWRAKVRQTLATGTAQMRQLAALDGVLDEMLSPREQRLLTSISVYLERRFNHRRQAVSPDDARWVDGFNHDMRHMLLAELHHRQQAIQGLVDAASAHQAGPPSAALS